jgi:TRAP-type mannitol/chloroaromatic compound transport system permease small subunit
VIFSVGYKSALRSWSDFERTMVGLPYITPIIKTAIPVAAALLLIQGVSEFIKNVRVLKGGHPDA